MMGRDVPLFGIGLQGKSPTITSQYRQNLYYEIVPDGERYQVAVYGTPGLQLFVDFGDTPARGMHAKGDFLYVMHRGTFYEVNNAGVKTSRGTISSTSGRVDMADNGTQVMIVDGTNGWIYTIATNTLTQITDPDFPPSPQTVDFCDGYFVINRGSTGRYYISAAYDGTSWAALDFANAEGLPDDLVRVMSRGDLVLFGEQTLEFAGNTGATDFPFARIQGANQEYGLAARWSAAKVGGGIAFLAKNRGGEVTVQMLSGYGLTRISNNELEYLINQYSSLSDATGFGYVLGGHPMYQLNFPTAGTSWLYDVSTQLWSSLKSDQITRHRAEIQENYLNTTVVSDYSNGKIYRLKPDVYTDNGAPIKRLIRGRHITQGDDYVTIDALQIDQETGVGIATGQGSNPQMMLRYSKDGGHTWSPEIWRPMGAIGNYKTRTRWTRLGRARDWVIELGISDPVKTAMMGVSMDTSVSPG